MTSDDHDRVFVALPVPEHVRAALAAATDPLRDRFDVAWTRSDGWHVTVAFVGDVVRARVPDLVTATADGVEAAGLGTSRGAGEVAVELALAAPRVLGGRAVVLDVADRPAGAVARLGASIQDAVAGAGLPVVRRRVVPHVTLARLRRRAGRRGAEAVAAALPALESTWTASAVVVYRSVLARGPARYEPVARLAFAR